MYREQSYQGRIPTNAQKELRCGNRVRREYYMTRHEGMIVWALAMFKRDWDVKSNNRSGWRQEWRGGITKIYRQVLQALVRCVEFKPGDGEITKIPIPLHPRPSSSWQQISSKPLTWIYIDLWDVSVHNTMIGLKFACINLLSCFCLSPRKTASGGHWPQGSQRPMKQTCTHAEAGRQAQQSPAPVN